MANVKLAMEYAAKGDREALKERLGKPNSRRRTVDKDEALRLALAFIERVNQDGWILDSFEPEMYATINAIKEALAKEWVNLTDEEMRNLFDAEIDRKNANYFNFARAIESILKEKNT